MNRRSFCLFLGAILAWPGPVHAAGELVEMYPLSRLIKERPRFQQRIGELYKILASLIVRNGATPIEQGILENVRIEYPPVDPRGSALNFYSYQTAAGPVVSMPLLSLLFVEDLCSAYAWLDRHGYSLETIDEYAAMLQYKPIAEFPESRYPPPLEALQIPSSAVDEPDTGQLGLRLRNSAYAFILAHELGHVVLGHPSYDQITMEQARQNEAQADQFALNTLAVASELPVGAVLYFQATAYMMPNRGAFIAQGRSGADLEAALRRQTHPLTADRLEAIGLKLQEQAAQSQSSTQSDVLRFIAVRLGKIAEILSDQDLQQCMAVAAGRAQMSDLKLQTAGATEKFLSKCVRRN
jgi:hypothetical protein